MSNELRFEILDAENFPRQHYPQRPKEKAASSGRHTPVGARVVPTRPPTTAQIDLAIDAQRWILAAAPVRGRSEEEIVDELIRRWCDGLLTERYGATPDTNSGLNAWQTFITKLALFVADLVLLVDIEHCRNIDVKLVPLLQKWGRRAGSNIQLSTAVEKRRESTRKHFQFIRKFANVIGNSAYIISLVYPDSFKVDDIESFKKRAEDDNTELEWLDHDAYAWFDLDNVIPIILGRSTLKKRSISLLIEERLGIPPYRLELYPPPGGGTAAQKRLRQLHVDARKEIAAEIATLKPTFDSRRQSTEDKLLPACAQFAEEAVAYVKLNWRVHHWQIIFRHAQRKPLLLHIIGEGHQHKDAELPCLALPLFSGKESMLVSKEDQKVTWPDNKCLLFHGGLKKADGQRAFVAVQFFDCKDLPRSPSHVEI